MKLSQRVSRIGESATLEFARRAKELAGRGVDVVDLSAGEPDFPSPPAAVEAAKRALDRGFTRYTAAAGIPELREALAQRFRAEHDAPWTGQQVAVTPGAKASLMALSLALWGPGDEVVVPSPYWVSFPAQLRFAGAEPVAVDTATAGGFRIRAEPLIAAMTDATRGVILNSPSNPSGAVIAREDLERIVEACAERGVPLVSDETYERFVYDGATHASAAELAKKHPRTVVLVGSFSKTYAMTGWRVGYCLGPPEIVQAVVRIQSHDASNPTSFAMVGALAAMRDGEEHVRSMRAEFASRRRLVMRLLSAIPKLTCAPPGGAFYAFADVSAFLEGVRGGSLELALRLLEEARVAVVPGVAFGDDRYIRISFCASEAALTEGLGRIGTALAAWGGPAAA